jgi:hypothetical protein
MQTDEVEALVGQKPLGILEKKLMDEDRGGMRI